MLFWCRDEIVADFSSSKIIKPELLPVKNWTIENILEFLERRVFDSTNTIARQMDMLDVKNHKSHKLSLSDCYWVKSENDNTHFDEITPYINDFATLEFAHGLSSPTLVFQGSFAKQWERKGNNTYIHKQQQPLQVDLEITAYNLAHTLGVPVGAVPIGAGEDIWVRNISDIDTMMLDFGSVFSKQLENGYSVKEVGKMYSEIGIPTADSYVLNATLFDAVIGNRDRKFNKGNWGFYKNSITGETRLAPLFDFNLATIEPHLEIDKRVENLADERLLEPAKTLLKSWENKINNSCPVEQWVANYQELTILI
jgi:hypothetical protein